MQVSWEHHARFCSVPGWEIRGRKGQPEGPGAFSSREDQRSREHLCTPERTKRECVSHKNLTGRCPSDSHVLGSLCYMQGDPPTCSVGVPPTGELLSNAVVRPHPGPAATFAHSTVPGRALGVLASCQPAPGRPGSSRDLFRLGTHWIRNPPWAPKCNGREGDQRRESGKRLHAGACL